MKEIKIRRYYLSEFMYDNYKDETTNIYDGFFVDLMPDEKDNDFTNFWLSCDGYGVRDHMFGIHNEDCDTDEKAQDFIERNVYEYIEYFVNKYFDDECECDCDECHEEQNFDSALLEAIDMHNEHVDKMHDLAQTLMDEIPNVDNTLIDKAYGDAFNSLIGPAIYLCCEANSLHNGIWHTTEDWFVVRDEDLEDDG